MRKMKIDVYTIYIDGVLKNKQWRQDVHKSAGRDDGQRNHCGTHLASVVPLPPRKKKKNHHTGKYSIRVHILEER